ncbi:DinB family protein [Roseiterribacter gracilis]
MNRRLYGAASRLDDAQRRDDRGAFFKSIHGTLNHLLWADQAWMSRFAGWDKPTAPGAQSSELFAAFDDMCAARTDLDARIEGWTAGLDQAWLDQDLTFFSGTLQRDVTMPRGLLLTHMFNHQTHHRGQVHAMLTAAGEKTGDTDLPFILP